jgi:hypothetical protein
VEQYQMMGELANGKFGRAHPQGVLAKAKGVKEVVVDRCWIVKNGRF